MLSNYFDKMEKNCSGAIKFIAKLFCWIEFLGVIATIVLAIAWGELLILLYSVVFVFDAMIRTPFLFGFAKIVETSELFSKLITNRKKTK